MEEVEATRATLVGLKVHVRPESESAVRETEPDPPRDVRVIVVVPCAPASTWLRVVWAAIVVKSNTFTLTMTQ